MPRTPERHRAPGWKPRVEQQRTYDGWRGTASSRGYDAAWKKIRDRKLAIDPLCEHCARDGRVTVAAMVHHVREVAVAPTLRLSQSNLESLCSPCHQAEHARRRST